MSMCLPLEKVAGKRRRLHVHVVAVLANAGKHRQNNARFVRQPQYRVQKDRHQLRVQHNLERVFVERGDGLDALGRVVKLVKQDPQDPDVVSRIVPPVKQPRVDQVRDQASRGG